MASASLPPPGDESPINNQRIKSTNVLLLLSLLLLGAIASPIWKPLLLAVVAGATMSRLHDKFARKLKNRRYLSASIFTIAALVLILAPLATLVAEAVSQAIDALNWARSTLARGGLSNLVRALPDAIENLVRPMLPKAAADLPGGTAGWAASQMQSVLATLSEFAFDLVMMLIAFFFVLTDGDKLVAWVTTVSPLGPVRTKELLEECRTVAKSVIGSNFLTGIAQAATATAGYFIAQAPKPLFFGLATLLSSFIPSVGTAVVALPLSLLLYLSGQPWSALFLAVWSLLVVALVDNILRPWLIKSDVHIHGALIFFSLIGGILLLGFVGLVVGPLVLALVASLVRFRARDVRKAAATPHGTPKPSRR